MFDDVYIANLFQILSTHIFINDKRFVSKRNVTDTAMQRSYDQRSYIQGVYSKSGQNGTWGQNGTLFSSPLDFCHRPVQRHAWKSNLQ